MIFVTVGTTSFPFNRLLKAVDQVLVNLSSKEELIVQKGISGYQFNYSNCQSFSEITFDKMIYFFKSARIVVTHGGPATIYLCLKYCQHKPLVVPRLKKFGEHVDNHQLFFVKFLEKQKLTINLVNIEKEHTTLKKYLLFPHNKIKKRFIADYKFVDKLIAYTESLKK